MEDFSGAQSFRVFGRDVAVYKNKIQVNDFVRLRVNVTASTYRPGALDNRIEEIEYLPNISNKLANAVNIYLDKNFKSQEFFSELMKFDAKDRPGDLFIRIYDRENNQKINVHSRRKFPITKELVQFLDDWGIKYDVVSI